mgnify:CR=1 FL=1
MTTRQLAEKVLALYWPQTAPFGETAAVLRQNAGSEKGARVLRLIEEFRGRAAGDPTAPLARARATAPVAFEQRRQPPPDAEIEAGPPVGRVGLPEIVPFRIRHHLEGQLVMVAQEDCPLALVGDLRRLPHDIGDGKPILARQRQAVADDVGHAMEDLIAAQIIAAFIANKNQE